MTQKSTVTNSTSIRACVLGNFLIFCLSLCFKLYIVASENLYPQVIPAIIHGALADLSIPMAATSIAFYFNKEILRKISIWVCYLTTLLVTADFLHITNFATRLNKELLDKDVLLSWLRYDRVTFLCILFFAWISFKIIARLPGPAYHTKNQKNRISAMLLSSLLLFLVQFPSSDSMIINKQSNWDDYLQLEKLLTTAQIEKASFMCLLTLTREKMMVSLDDILINSPFFSMFENQYQQHAVTSAKAMSEISISPIWLHMGFYNERIPPNSLQAFTKAINKGFSGVEIDVHYLENEDRIVVCHDLPSQPQLYKSLPDLDQYLMILAKDKTRNVTLWLDFKNLNNNYQLQAINKLKSSAEKYEVMESLIVESFNPFILRSFSKAGFKTLLAFFYGLPEARLQKQDLKVVKAYATLSGCKAISLPWQIADESTRQLLYPMPIAIYSVDDRETLQQALAIPQIVIILADTYSLEKNDK